VRLGERVIIAIGTDADDEVKFVHAAAHVPVQHKPDPAEHFFLNEAGLALENLADALGQAFIKCH
jgi:hypothetical protein